MIKGFRLLSMCVVVAVLAAAPYAQAQGKPDKGHQQHGSSKGGKGKDGGNQGNAGRQQDKGGGGRDKAEAAAKRDNRGKSKGARSDDDGRGPTRAEKVKDIDVSEDRGRGRVRNFKHVVRVTDLHPSVQRYATSGNAKHRIVAGALGRGMARGLDDDAIIVRDNGSRTLLVNRSGAVLVDLDDDRARNLGGWRVDPYDDDVRSDAPAFCRSGEGHPVWGREWCLNKGFGLGDYRDVRWGRTTNVVDIVFRRADDRATLARDVLIGVLGDVVLNRLGLHAVTLGYADPLTGVWLGEPTGPQVLRLTSGGYPVAEIYDENRDNRADALVVALRPW
jgi:hypothetical protein